MVIVDSSVLIEYLGGRSSPGTEWLRRQRNFRHVGITNLVLAEVLQGVRDNRAFLATESALNRFVFFEIGTRELAIRSASNYRTLRAAGITIRSTIDCLIATFCIESGYQLLHHDSDFDYFEATLGLCVLHPSEPQ
ncbi:MAG TPA: PIN domain nuclease [Terracidiphilus sp.]|jgi:predicted nucleic acid-binding protein|nr:PIN domain nuclease [Terracidiphilus sp.]